MRPCPATPGFASGHRPCWAMERALEGKRVPRSAGRSSGRRDPGPRPTAELALGAPKPQEGNPLCSQRLSHARPRPTAQNELFVDSSAGVPEVTGLRRRGLSWSPNTWGSVRESIACGELSWQAGLPCSLIHLFDL